MSPKHGAKSCESWFPTFNNCCLRRAPKRLDHGCDVKDTFPFRWRADWEHGKQKTTFLESRGEPSHTPSGWTASLTPLTDAYADAHCLTRCNFSALQLVGPASPCIEGSMSQLHILECSFPAPAIMTLQIASCHS